MLPFEDKQLGSISAIRRPTGRLLIERFERRLNPSLRYSFELLHPMPHYIRLLLVLATLSTGWAAGDKPLAVSVYSRVANDYERELGDDGKPERQFYAIAYGGRIDGTLWNQDQKKEDFPEIAGIIAEELAKQNYHFAPDKETADLMVIIHWGLTNPYGQSNFSDGVNIAGDAFRALKDAQAMAAGPAPGGPDAGGPGAVGGVLMSEQNQALQDANAQLDSALTLLQMEQRVQAHRQEDTARVLGYTDELARNNDIARYAGSGRFDTLIEEVQSPRYYVVITAYDFDEITNQEQNKPAPQWVTRFSIRARGNNFMERIEEMAFRAGGYFGRESGRLIRDFHGDVEIGDMEIVSTSETDKEPDTN